MKTRIPLWAVALVLLPFAGLALAQGIQSGVLHNFVGPITISDSVRTPAVTILATDGTTTGTITNDFGSGIAIATPADGQLVLNIPGNGLALLDAKTLNVGTTTATAISVGNLNSTTTVNGTLAAGSTKNAGAVLLDGGGAGTFTTYATAHCTCTSQTQALTPVACSAPSGGVVTITGAAGETVAYTCL